jgi:thiol:disulfide interchange protein DsbA
MLRKIFILFCLILPVFASATTFIAGTDYKVLKVNNGGLTHSRGKVELVEFFNPGCPWCFKLEASLEQWLKHKPRYVKFSRVPLAFESGWNVYQRAYYVSVALNKAHSIIPAMFRAIHVENHDLASQDKLQAFFKQHGVDKITFDQYYNSPSIDLQVSHANQLMMRYQVYSIPTFIINGKYLVSAAMAKGDNKRLIEIINYLVKNSR